MAKMMSRMVPIDMESSPNFNVGLPQGKAAPFDAAVRYINARIAREE
jgi:hypothetical protein